MPAQDNLQPQLFHGTKHDIKHLVRPSKDTDLDNYDYGGSLPKSHRERTFAMSGERMAPDWTPDAPEGGTALGNLHAERHAWNWARGPGRPRVHTVEPATKDAPVDSDPIIIGAVMHRGAMRVKDTTWIPPLAHARTEDSTSNWEHVAEALPGGGTAEHVQGTLPPLNWDQHHRYYSHEKPAQGERNTDLVDSIERRFDPADPDWHEAKKRNDEYDRKQPGYNQDPLFPAGQYYDPQAGWEAQRKAAAAARQQAGY